MLIAFVKATTKQIHFQFGPYLQAPSCLKFSRRGGRYDQNILGIYVFLQYIHLSFLIEIKQMEK